MSLKEMLRDVMASDKTHNRTLRLKSGNIVKDLEDMEVEFDSDWYILKIYCYVPAMDTWIDMTEKVTQIEYLLDYILNEKDKYLDQMTVDMKNRHENRVFNELKENID